MKPTILEQARFLHKTIKALQNKLLHRFGPVVLNANGIKLDLTMAQLSTMAAIRDMDAASLKELASAMHISPPSASSMVEKLVEMGAVTREPGKHDRREIRVALTSAGLTAVNTMEEQMLQALGDTLEAIGPQYAAQMVEVYEQVEASIELEQPSPSRTGQKRCKEHEVR